MDEWTRWCAHGTSRHTTAEVVERAALLRITVATVQDGRSVRGAPALPRARVFVKNPDGDFVPARAPPY